MAEQTQLVFTYKEVVEALISQQGLSSGIWRLYIKFGIAAANIRPAPAADANPAAIVPVLEIGLQKDNEVTNLSVDAAALSKKKAVKGSRKRGKDKLLT